MSKIRLATVVGFPMGYTAIAAKSEEIKRAIDEGTDDIDAVIKAGLNSAVYGTDFGDALLDSLAATVTSAATAASDPPLPDADRAKLMNDAAGVAQSARREVETVLRSQADRVVSEMDLVRREDLEIVQDLAEGRGGKDGPAYSKWADQMMRKAPIRRV